MITEKLFNSLFPTKGLSPRKYNLVRERGRLIAVLNDLLPRYEINTHKRICAFLANCGIETDYFKTTEEYASGWAYDISYNPEKAQDLGNTRKGDGPRYKGSGLTQTTGKNNFIAVQKAIGTRLGVDVVKNPEILRENIETAVESACIFWKDNKLNYYADRGLFKNLSAIVNRGDKNKTPLHWAKRNELYSKLLRYVPKEFSFEPVTSSEDAKPALPVGVLTPTENSPALGAANIEQEAVKSDSSFLADAFDKNISSEEIKSSARTAAPKILVRISRPFVMLYAALEAGNIYAWFGVAVGFLVAGLLIYWHRNDLKKIWQKVKNKFLQ